MRRTLRGRAHRTEAAGITVILIDTGPIVALINRRDPNHLRCLEATRRLPAAPLVTTWPCFTESMYLLFRSGGHPAQATLWKMITADKVLLHDHSREEMDRMESLMIQYRDTPMDLADASLVAAAEHLGFRRLFTIDRDFLIYRLADKSAFELVPWPV